MFESIENNHLCLRSNHVNRDFSAVIQRLRSDDSFTDIAIKCGDISIRAHKLVLCSCSAYFDRMFSSSAFVESSKSRIEMNQVKPEILGLIIDFFYSGSLKVASVDVVDLLKAADLLFLHEVKKGCVNFLKRTLSTENCVRIWSLAETYCEQDLADYAKRFLERNFSNVAATKTFIREMTFTAFIVILEAKRLSVKSEDDLLRFILGWYEFDKENRISCLTELFGYLNGPSLSSSMIDNLDDEQVKDALKRGAKSFSGQDRKLAVNKIIIAVASNSKHLEYLDLDYFEEGFNVLTEIPDLRYGFGGCGLAAYGDLVAVTGGVGKKGILKATKRFLTYNLRTNEWQEGPDMLEARKCHASQMIGSSCFVFGGTDERHPVASVECLDLAEEPREWRKVAELPSWHNGPVGALIQEDKFLMISAYGADNDKTYSNVDDEVKDFVLERSSRDHPGVATCGPGEIVIAGGSLGREYLKDTEWLHDDRWEKGQDLQVAREGPALVQVELEDGNKHLLAIGGRGSKGTVELYKAGSWNVVEDLKVQQPNEEYVAVVLNK